MNRGTHIIQKQRYEIKTRKQKMAMDMQQRLGDINTLHILPLLAKKLDEYFPAQKIITIERLEIDIGKIQKNATDSNWADMILERLEEQLQVFEETTMQKIESSEQSFVAGSWIYFLKHGMLPAGSVYSSVPDLRIALMRSGEAERKTIKYFLSASAEESILKRLIANTDKESLKFHFQLLASPVSDDDFYRIHTEIDELFIQLSQKTSGSPRIEPVVFRFALLLFIFKKLLSSKVNSRISIPQLITEMRHFVQQTIIDDPLSKTEDSLKTNLPAVQDKFEKVRQANKSSEVNNNEKYKELSLLPGKEIFISDAGLCLVANWLIPFFKETDLVNGGNFIDAEKQQHAIFLLHFLATKEMQPTEELLVLPKLLCGWPLQMPAINTMSISDKEKAECEDLLKSVIQHWAVLKNTSADGLRESFLQRPGKLTESKECFLLQPEQQSIDILLEQISWSFQFIKMPWMKKPLQTDWY